MLLLTKRMTSDHLHPDHNDVHIHDHIEDKSEEELRRKSIARRRSSIFRPPPNPEPTFTWKTLDEDEWAIVQDDHETTLIHHKNEISSMTNFGIEVRGLRDVKKLLQDSIIILSPKHTVLKDLIEEILHHGSSPANINTAILDEIHQQLFTDSKGKIFANTLQGFIRRDMHVSSYDQSWLCAVCDLPSLRKRSVAIVRLKHPTNFGESCRDVRFFILVLCPSKTKETKTALETGRTFATLFSDPYLRNALLMYHSEDVFRDALTEWASKVAKLPVDPSNDDGPYSLAPEDSPKTKKSWCCGIGSGIKKDLARRLPHYVSDYTDGIVDGRSIQKTISSSVFLYFACLLPTIAFATLNSHTTGGRMDIKKGIFAQTVGQMIFAIVGGQHLSILLTTAPLSLFVKIIFSLSEIFEIVDQFEAFYCCVGLWCSFFLFLSAIFNMSKIMKFCTRSTEEIFALFISIAFVFYAVRDVTQEFQKNYLADACKSHNTTFLSFANNHTNNSFSTKDVYSIPHFANDCRRDSSLLYMFLMLGTFWVGYTLYNFKNTPFLQRGKRELLSDYALPIAVILFSFIGSFLFKDIPAERFMYDGSKPLLKLAPVTQLDWTIILISAILGFNLAVLIFMDQNIGSAIVNNPSNKLTKGSSYNWDLVVISLINVFSSLFTLPWLHVALPHAPMHVKSLADVEERVEHGQIKQMVVRVRETRLTTILSHILMGLSLLLLPYPLSYILPSVFDGLYLYMGITALGGNQLFERILLIFTEQMSYPPNHYIRCVPQRKIHQFTLLQVLHLVLLCVLGFFPIPFVKVLFPLVLLFLLFSRQVILPGLIDKKYLDILD